MLAALCTASAYSCASASMTFGSTDTPLPPWLDCMPGGQAAIHPSLLNIVPVQSASLAIQSSSAPAIGAASGDLVAGATARDPWPKARATVARRDRGARH